MRDYTELTGMIIKTGNLAEYDKRLVVLTDTRGKITVFARGVRRQHSKYLAACEPFVFGEFKLIEGKDAYSLLEVRPTQFFESLRYDIHASCLGMYFLEIADYYARENTDELQMLKLLYISLSALSKGVIDPRLIRAVFELKTIMINGEFPGIIKELNLSDSSVYTIQYIMNSELKKLYSFQLTDNVLDEICKAATWYRMRAMGSDFKSLEILDVL